MIVTSNSTCVTIVLLISNYYCLRTYDDVISGSIDQIGSDIQRIKDMGVDHIVFGYNFVPIGRNVTKVIDLSKEPRRRVRRVPPWLAALWPCGLWSGQRI